MPLEVQLRHPPPPDGWADSDVCSARLRNKKARRTATIATRYRGEDSTMNHGPIGQVMQLFRFRRVV
jgi:hypothetical protein